MERVLFINHSAALGGAELSLLDIARGFGDRATVLLFEDGPFRHRLEENGVPVLLRKAPPALMDVRRSTGLLALLRVLPEIVRFITALVRLIRPYEVVYTNSQKALAVGSIAGWLARRPVIWHLRDILTADHFSNINRRIAVTLANLFVDRVIANSASTASAFAESGGRTKTELVYNGIGAASFDSVTTEQVARLRQELDLGDAPVVGVFSRLAPWKGQHVLLDAVAEIPDVHVLLVGDALFGEDSDYVRRLHAQCEAMDLTNRVHFLGFRNDIPTLMHLVDIVVHTSTAPEPFGRVIVEGMLAETPVVATEAGGAREIITSGENGLLVSPDDPSALRTSLTQLLSAPDWAQQLARKGRETARTRFSPEAMLPESPHT